MRKPKALNIESHGQFPKVHADRADLISDFIDKVFEQAVSDSLAECKEELHKPSTLFFAGGFVQVARLKNNENRSLVASIDTTCCEARSLVGSMVAVLTASGIEVRWLDVEDDLYLLLPFEPGQTIKRLRSEGEWSIVGLVRWIGNEPGQTIKRLRSESERSIAALTHWIDKERAPVASRPIEKRRAQMTTIQSLPRKAVSKFQPAQIA